MSPTRSRPPMPADASSAGSGSAPSPVAGSRPGKRLQMADIARLAGVSVSTVSRALAGSELVNAETRARISELARSVNYTINQGAQNLRLQKNRTVAVVIPFDASSRQHLSDPFFLAIMGSIADALTDRGYEMLLMRVDADKLDSAALPFDTGRAIGVIMIGQWKHHDQLNAMAARQVPLAVWGAELPQQLYCTVGGDNRLGGQLATRHLLATGHRRIAFVGDPQLPEVSLRHAGHVQALRAAGIEPDSSLLFDVPFDEDSARRALKEAWYRGARFDGVVACSDVLALQAVAALRACGQRVPLDVAVIGYDDTSLAAWCDPPLTTVHQPVTEAGVELVDALLAQVEGMPQAPRTLPVGLKVRLSAPG